MRTTTASGHGQQRECMGRPPALPWSPRQRSHLRASSHRTSRSACERRRLGADASDRDRDPVPDPDPDPDPDRDPDSDPDPDRDRDRDRDRDPDPEPRPRQLLRAPHNVPASSRARGPDILAISPMQLDERQRLVLEQRPGVRLAYLFGSAARGTARPSSDVDVAVLAYPGVDLDELAAALEKASERHVDLVDLRVAPPLLLREIVRDGIVLVARDDGERAAFELRALCTYLDTGHLRQVQHAYLRDRAEARRGAAL
jgi:predicted nucleotidyltransferase